MLKVMKKKLLVVIAMLVVASGIIFTGSTSTKAEDNEVQYLGKYKLTAYCGCKKCSGKWGARTASGKKAKQGRTIAVDKRKIKLGSKVQINGKTYVAEDVGGGVKGKHIDIFYNTHSETRNLINRQRNLVRKQVLKFIR